MRPKRILTILVCVIAVVIALACFITTKSKPRISMGLLEYDYSKNDFGSSIIAVVGLTNNGLVTVRYDHVDSDEPFVLRAESRTGWVSKAFYSTQKITLSPSLLAPGSNTTLYLYPPDGTLRWQLKYTIHSASIQRRIGSQFTGDWGDRLYSLLGRNGLFTNDGPPQAFWSEVFEMPGGKQSGTPTNATILKSGK